MSVWINIWIKMASKDDKFHCEQQCEMIDQVHLVKHNANDATKLLATTP